MPAAETVRPDPDALLREARPSGRGRLKIFLGASPGVGKTFAMLEDARRQARNGVDVVAAVIETHGRAETAELLDGLELLPRRLIDYRGQQLSEMDIDGLLARRPALALIDEYAHTNVVGGRHPKRWQDVEEVLASGIDVYSTLNIQHIESLNDVVARITGVRVQETVPDDALARADEIELIDLPPEELIDRLRQGKVYVREQAGRALANFFSKGNLTALRELAMRTAAHRVDSDVTHYMQAHGVAGPWPTQERLLVCVNEAPGAKALVRAGKRMADRSKLPWIVATVVTPRHLALGPAAEQQRHAALQLAESLGAEAVTLHAESKAADELIAYARKRNVTRLVVGRPRPRRFFGWWREPVSDALIDAATDFEVTVVSAPVKRERRRLSLRVDVANWRGALPVIGEVAAAMTVATAVAWPFWPILPVASIAIPYLVAVLFVGMRRGLAASLVASALGFLVYNFFFTTPYYSLQVEQFESIVALAVFLISAVFTGTLASRLKAQVEAMRQSQKRTQTLYDFSRRIAAAGSLDDVLWAVVHHIAATLDCQSAVLMPDQTGQLKVVAGFPPIDDLDPKDWGAAQFSWKSDEMAGKGTQTLPAADWLFAPLATRAGKIGLIGVSFSKRGGALDPETKRLVAAVEDQAAVAIERARLAADLQDTRVQAETEKLRAALLNSVSHDLRTPLVSIIGAASTLAAHGEGLSSADQHDLSDTVLSEAQRLNRYVQNLLDMTRLGYGALTPRRAATDLREIVGSVRADLASALEDRRLIVDIESDLPPLDVDPVLIAQALANVMENAAKYTPRGATITVRAGRGAHGFVDLTIADEGPGIPTEDRAKVFDHFYRVRAGDGQPAGTGLGLAIAKGFVEAHGGAIRADAAENGRGAAIIMSLPIAQRDKTAEPDR